MLFSPKRNITTFNYANDVIYACLPVMIDLMNSTASEVTTEGGIEMRLLLLLLLVAF